MKGGWVSDGNHDFTFSMGGVRWFACLHLDLYWRDLYRLENVTARQRMGSMNEMDVVIEQMVSEIWAWVYQLDDPRLEMFLDWLTMHSAEMQRTFGNFLDMDHVVLRGVVIEGQFRLALKGWLQSIPVQGLLWEYKTVVAEIDWWRDLDPLRLKMITKTEVES